MARIRRRRSGQAIVIVAFAVTVLFGLVLVSVDGATLYLDRRQLQNAADAGALAGAFALSKTPIPTYLPGHQQALGVVADNLPGTSPPAVGTILDAPGPQVFNIGAGYSITVTAQVAGTGFDWYKVRIQHTRQLGLAPVLGFLPTLPVIAEAQAQSGTYPFALILFQNDATQYDNLYPGGNTAVQLLKASGSIAGGGGFSNEGFGIGTGVGAAMSFSPCGGAGDLWAVNENPASGTNLANLTTGQTGDSTCSVHPPSYPKPQVTPLPFPNYPEAAACSVPSCTYSTPLSLSSGTTYLCPGTYTSTIAVTTPGTLVIVMPGVYRFTAANALNLSGGMLRIASPADFPASGTFVNCPGAPTAPADSDYGVSLEFAPPGCNVNQLTMSGGAQLDISPSAKYNKINLYVELYGGAGWHTTCPYVNAPLTIAGTHVINISGSGSYSIRGAIYGPAENATLAGNGSGYGIGQALLWTATVVGNGTLKENYDPAYLPYFRGLIQ
jgi:hypothetical protein